MFTLVKIVPGREPETQLAYDGKPLVFSSGKEAAEAAKAYSDTDGVKYQPRPIKDDAWIAREQYRFTDGTYTALPEWFPHKPEHYAHHSMDDMGKVAYTVDALKGAADRQTVCKPGVYLAKFFEDELGTDGITELARRFAGEFEDTSFNLATDADTIQEVYENGPSSCMSHKAGCYDSPIHPVRVYAAGDLAIAYLGSAEEATARCVCWPEKLVYGRIYGDDDRLASALREAGYTRGSCYSFEGARLSRVDDDGSFVVPYLDCCQRVTDDGEFLVIATSGDLCADQTNGLLGDTRVTCYRCEERVAENDTGVVYLSGYHSEDWCSCCRENDAIYCDDINEYVAVEAAVTMADGAVWSEWGFSADGFTCAGTDDNYSNEYRDAEFSDYCEDYAEDNREELREGREKAQVAAERALLEAEGQMSLPLPPAGLCLWRGWEFAWDSARGCWSQIPSNALAA